MALPEYMFDDEFILTPEDLTPETLDAFHRFCSSADRHATTCMAAFNGPAQQQHARTTRYYPADPLDDDAALLDWALS